MPPEIEPQIVIRLKKVPVPGQPGSFMLEPVLEILQFPGGTPREVALNVHRVLCQCVQKVMDYALQESPAEKPQVGVYTSLPHENGQSWPWQWKREGS
jgi:hypothetical protein